MHIITLTLMNTLELSYLSTVSQFSRVVHFSKVGVNLALGVSFTRFHFSTVLGFALKMGYFSFEATFLLLDILARDV